MGEEKNRWRDGAVTHNIHSKLLVRNKALFLTDEKRVREEGREVEGKEERKGSTVEGIYSQLQLVLL